MTGPDCVTSTYIHTQHPPGAKPSEKNQSQRKRNSKPQQCRNDYGKCHIFKTRELKQRKMAKSAAPFEVLVLLLLLTLPLPPLHLFLNQYTQYYSQSALDLGDVLGSQRRAFLLTSSCLSFSFLLWYPMFKTSLETRGMCKKTPPFEDLVRFDFEEGTSETCDLTAASQLPGQVSSLKR